MATDYDAPRRGDVDELNEDSIEELKARGAEAQSGSIDVDETELAGSLELPGADLSNMSGEELTVRVLPKQSDEFTCSSCFLVHHRSRLARARNGPVICRDCASLQVDAQPCASVDDQGWTGDPAGIGGGEVCNRRSDIRR